MVSLISTITLKEHVNMLREAAKFAEPEDMTFEEDYADKGTVKITAHDPEGDIVVLSAIQKGRNGPWITKWRDCQLISWKTGVNA